MLELSAFNLLAGVAWVVVLLWLGAVFRTFYAMKRQQPLEPVAAGDRSLMKGDAPLVSVLVPARNEEKRVLDQCIRSILSQDYGQFEVIAVNDRSTDATGPILHAIARAEKKLRVIEGVEPPAGWLGKPHALQQALNASRGEWVLATDADMLFGHEAVRTAVAHALAGGFDAVTLIPHVRCLSFWERVFMPTFGWLMLMAVPVHRINNPKRREALGVGGFFMVRRSWLRRVGEYGAVQAEVAEDLRMAEILKQAGARLRIDYAPDLISTRMQTNFREIWEGFSKNLFAGTKFSLLQTMLGVLFMLLVAVLPPIVALWSAVALAAGLPGEWLRLFIPNFTVWLVQVLVFAFVNRRTDVPAVYALTVPLGMMLMLAILVNSAIRIKTGAGVTWKGRKLYERAGVQPPVTAGTTPDLPVADE